MLLNSAPGLADFKARRKPVTRELAQTVVWRYYTGMMPNEQPKRVRRVILTLSCPPALADRLDDLVRATGRTGSEILRSALVAYLEGQATT